MTARSQLTRRGMLAALSATPVAAAGAAAPPRRRLTLLETYVAGTGYYDAPRVRVDLRPGEALVLRREPGNAHDELAIEVFTGAGAKLGYVPQADNEPFARLIDAGRTVSARVIEVDPARYDDIWIALALHGA